MKVVVVVWALIVATAAGSSNVSIEKQEEERQMMERITRYRNECKSETGVSDETLNLAADGEFPIDENFKCFTKCFYMKAGFVDDNGTVQLDTIRKKLPKELNQETELGILISCMNLPGSNSCDKVFNIHKCYFTLTRGDTVKTKHIKK